MLKNAEPELNAALPPQRAVRGGGQHHAFDHFASDDGINHGRVPRHRGDVGPFSFPNHLSLIK